MRYVFRFQNLNILILILSYGTLSACKKVSSSNNNDPAPSSRSLVINSPSKSAVAAKGWMEIKGECESAGDGLLIKGDTTSSAVACLPNGQFQVVVNLKKAGKNSISISQLQSDGKTASAKISINAAEAADIQTPLLVRKNYENMDGSGPTVTGIEPFSSSYDGNLLVFSTTKPGIYVDGQAPSGTGSDALHGPIVYNASSHEYVLPVLNPDNSELASTRSVKISLDGKRLLLQSRNSDLLNGQLAYTTGLVTQNFAVDGSDFFVANHSEDGTSLASSASDGHQSEFSDFEGLEVLISSWIEIVSGKGPLYQSTNNSISRIPVFPSDLNVNVSATIRHSSPDGNMIVFGTNYDFSNGGITMNSGVFVYDRKSSTVEDYAIKPTTGQNSIGYPYYAHLSLDQKIAIFDSYRTEFLNGDASNTTGNHIYIQDRESGDTVRITQQDDMSVLNTDTQLKGVSMDSRFILFFTRSSGLCENRSIPGSENCLLIYDRNSNTKMVVTPDGDSAVKGVLSANLSADGRFIFVTSSLNLNEVDTNGEKSIFRIPNPFIFSE